MVAEETLNAKIIEKAWLDAEFKEKLMSDPRSAIRDAFDIDFPEQIQLTAVEETKSHFFLVIPPNPKLKPDSKIATEGTW